VGDEAELLRHDIRVLRQLLAASRDRAQETGGLDGQEGVFARAYAAVLEERLERLREVERERGLG
jgi:hypothetical protein